jgi:hypothetical protein
LLDSAQAILTSSFAAIGTLSPEANPALAGQDVYTRAAKDNIQALQIMDKQIFRRAQPSPWWASLHLKAHHSGRKGYHPRRGRLPCPPGPPAQPAATWPYLLRGPLRRFMHDCVSSMQTFLYLLDFLAERVRARLCGL